MTLPPTPLKHLATVLTLILVVALGVQVAWWGWHFFKPKLSLEGDTISAVSVDMNAARQLFGKVNVTAAATVTDNNTGIRLKGVYAVDGKTLSAAVINTGGRDTSVRLNEKITDAITLVDVKADHIIISRAGVREKLEIERNIKSSTTASAATTAPAAPQANFRLNVASTTRNTYALSRGELNSVLQDPRQINFLGGISPAPAGGVQISSAESGTLAQKLGLQVGDIITNINGQPVNSTGDLARFYGQFASTNTIRAEIKRAGAPMMLSYTINP
jgi:general secretion pathway protein C